MTAPRAPGGSSVAERATRLVTAARTRRGTSLVVACVVVVVIVVLARWLRTVPAVETFVAHHPGPTALPSSAPTGIPAWLAWQHGINVFFLLLVVRSGLQFRRTPRPSAYFTRKNRLPRTRKPPQRISIDLWLHLSVDTLFVVNGVLFYVLLFSTGQWLRVVPTSWSVVPDAASAALQYASLDWPTEDGWTAYNGLQLLTYFLVVFVLAPAAIVTGLRMSPALSRRSHGLVRLLPIAVARRRHRQVLILFLGFTAVHVLLVLTTGVRRNLNHVYAATNGDSWWGTAIFVASLLAMAGVVAALRPVVLRALASTMGKVGR